MRRASVSFALFLAAFATPLVADCAKPVVQLQPSGKIDITFCDQFVDDKQDSKIEQGATFSIDVDNVSIPLVAGKVVVLAADDIVTGVQVEATATNPAAPEVALIGVGGTAAKLHVNAQTFDVDVHGTNTDLYQNYGRYTWSIGPATKGNEGGETPAPGAASRLAITPTDTPATDNSSSGAFRLQLNGEYAKGQPLVNGSKFPLQTVATLSIDTTDQNDPGFVDNNRGTVGVQTARLSAGNLFKQGRIGIEARASKAFHQDVHDFDGVLKVAGWLPWLPSLNIFNRNGNFLAPPLSFSASYGYRNRQQTSDTFHGRVFEATALYHLFALDRFNLDVNGTWTINDISNRPAVMPRTQKLYKATISYLENLNSGFTILTTIENGSAGVMLAKVRQYFVGVALSKINFSGGSKKP